MTKENGSENTANREYKATFFSTLFSEPSRLRELYNALAGTDYGEETPIEINTLENVFFTDLKNDVSFTIGGKFVVLIEHQSTINANMPLRCLMYIADVYKKITSDTSDRDIYRRVLLRVPTPEFLVLYNGKGAFPEEKTLRLSDAYIATDETLEKFGNLELTVRVLNINPGYNEDIKQKSESLYGYSAFVERVNHNQKHGRSLRDAVSESIKWLKEQDVLTAFLTEHGSEASNMLYTEFNIDIAKEVWQEEAYEDGRMEGIAIGEKKGIAIGKSEGIAVGANRILKLLEKGHTLEEIKAILDSESVKN